jgi:predicted component of type VI protein secretion system
MARQKDGQKFIGESRAPRVQIEYDVEVYGSQIGLFLDEVPQMQMIVSVCVC